MTATNRKKTDTKTIPPTTDRKPAKPTEGSVRGKKKRSSLDQKLRLAQQANTRVIVVRNLLTHDALNIVSMGDIAVHRLQYKGDSDLQVLWRYHEVLDQLEKVTRELCVEAGISYDVERRIR